MDPGFKEAVTSKLPQRPKIFKVPEPMDISSAMLVTQNGTSSGKEVCCHQQRCKSDAELTTALTSNMEIQSLEFAQLVPVLIWRLKISDWLDISRDLEPWNF